MSRCILVLLAVLPFVQGGLFRFPLPDFSNNCAAVTCPNFEVDPQCCNGQDFPNSCLARCSNNGDLSSCKPGSCSDDNDNDNNNNGDFCDRVRCSSEPTNPLCCDGETYPNECVAQCGGGFKDVANQCVPGECGVVVDPVPIDCSVVLCAAGFTDPVCCEGTTYGNPCLAQCTGGFSNVAEECQQGFCPGDDLVCTEEYDPVCCGDTTFSNLCKARLDLGDVVDDICVKGECQDQIFCPAVYDPVCCFDDEQFGNECEAGIEYGDLPNFDEVCVKGECQDQVFCPAIYDPVCCFDDQQFGNKCEAGIEYGDLPNFDEVCVQGECSTAGGGDPGLPSCPNGITAQCFIDPCQFSTCGYDGAVCLSNYCVEDIEYLGSTIEGPCTAVWVDAEYSMVLSKQQCAGLPSIFHDFKASIFEDFFP